MTKTLTTINILMTLYFQNGGGHCHVTSRCKRLSVDIIWDWVPKKATVIKPVLSVKFRAVPPEVNGAAAAKKPKHSGKRPCVRLFRSGCTHAGTYSLASSEGNNSRKTQLLTKRRFLDMGPK